LAPQLLGYAYEERNRQAVGFLFEELHGNFANIGDLEVSGKPFKRFMAWA
jgi:hypothetical protein